MIDSSNRIKQQLAGQSPTAVLVPEIFRNIHKYILCQAINEQGGEIKAKERKKKKRLGEKEG